MIPGGMQVFISLEPVDLRAGFERLAGLVRERIGYELTESALFVFFGKRRDAVKVVFVDGTGRCLFHKKLARGTFTALDDLVPGATHVELDEASFETLLDGLPLSPQAPRTSAPRRRVH